MLSPFSRRLRPLATIVSVQDYAGVSTAKRGRCHRLVYGSEDRQPAVGRAAARSPGLTMIIAPGDAEGKY